MSWVRLKPGGGVSLVVMVQPNAKATEVVGIHGGALKIRVASPPVDGAANEALVEFLAESLQVKKRDVVVRQGANSRRKILEVMGIEVDHVLRSLKVASASS